MSTSSEPFPFAALLRQHRQAAGLTQREIADKAGLGTRGVSDLERGVRSTPHQDTVLRLASALGLVEDDWAVFVAAARRQRQYRPAAKPRHIPSVLSSFSTTAPPLVGRLNELAKIDQLLAGTSPPVLILAGEPGIGKTRLLREAAMQAAALGWCVLTAGSRRRGGQEAYATLADALARHLSSRTPAQQRQTLRGCAWLVRLLPELADSIAVPSPIGTLSSDQERRLMIGALKRFLANIAGPAGVLLVLDDVQWADADVFDLLAALLRPAGYRPLRVIAAYRSTEVRPGSLLTATLAELARDGLVDRYILYPLSAAESAALLAHVLQAMGRGWSAELTAQVVQRTGGVPFFLVSCAQSPRATCGAEQADDGAIPWTIQESVRQRVAALPAAAQDVIAMVAAAAPRISRSLLVAVARQMGHAEEVVVRALEEAIAAGLLLSDERSDTYAFAHDLIFEVVAGDLGLARRKFMHLRLAEAFQRLPSVDPAG
ncbi:MAG: ATP-binding protein [Ktedonobacterales bacterium]